MKIISLLFALITILFLSSCGTIQPLNYFEVNAYSKPFDKKAQVPINLVLLDEVKDNLEVEGEGLKKMEVTEFRRSFSESMKSTLEKNFENVSVLSKKPDEGLSLVVYRVRPFWKINSQSASTIVSGGIVIPTTTTLVSAAFQFESSLFLNNEKLESADLVIYSEDQMSNVHQAHQVFKSGLIKTCETINKELFKDDIISKITDH